MERQASSCSFAPGAHSSGCLAASLAAPSSTQAATPRLRSVKTAAGAAEPDSEQEQEQFFTPPTGHSRTALDWWGCYATVEVMPWRSSSGLGEQLAGPAPHAWRGEHPQAGGGGSTWSAGRKEESPGKGSTWQPRVPASGAAGAVLPSSRSFEGSSSPAAPRIRSSSNAPLLGSPNGKGRRLLGSSDRRQHRHRGDGA